MSTPLRGVPPVGVRAGVRVVVINRGSGRVRVRGVTVNPA